MLSFMCLMLSRKLIKSRRGILRMRLGFFGALVFGLFLFVWASGGAFAQAVSSQEALEFVGKAPAFLNKGESGEVFLQAPLSYKSSSFWVVSLVSNRSVVGMVPLAASGSLLVPSESESRRELVRAGYFLRQFSVLKSNAEASGQWPFSSVESKFFSDLSANLSEEELSMAAVQAEIADFPLLRAQAAELVGDLRSLKSKSAALSDSLSSANTSVTALFSQPSVADLEKAKLRVSQALSDLVSFDEAVTAYASSANALGLGIASSDLSIDSKRSLQSLIAPPPRLSAVGSRANAALQLEEAIQKEWDNRLARSSSFLSDLELRLARSEAHRALFGSDEAVVSKSNGSLSSVESLVLFVLREEAVDRWREQSLVNRMRADWQKATSFYGSGDYASARQFGVAARSSGLSVFAAGFSDPPVVEADYSPWFTWAAVGLLVLAVLFFVLRNFGKIKGALVSSAPAEENYDAYLKP